MSVQKHTYIITAARADGTIGRYEVEQSTMALAARWVSRNLDVTETDTVTIHRKGA